MTESTKEKAEHPKSEYYVEVSYKGESLESKNSLIQELTRKFHGRTEFTGAFKWRFGIKPKDTWIQYRVDFATWNDTVNFCEAVRRIGGYDLSSIMW